MSRLPGDEVSVDGPSSNFHSVIVPRETPLKEVRCGTGLSVTGSLPIVALEAPIGTEVLRTAGYN